MGNIIKGVAIVIGIWLILVSPVLLVLWSEEPTPKIETKDRVIGQTTVDTTIMLAETLLNKPGGFLSNDVIIPSIFMDNMPAYEVAVIRQLRIMAQVLRNEHSRSQTQSKEDPDLVLAETSLTINTDSWIFPSAESEYQIGIDALKRYSTRLGDSDNQDGQFYARADNLVAYLEKVNVQLGGMSQSLSANIGQRRINIDLANDPSAEQSTPGSDEIIDKNPWLLVDDVWWSARGGTWAILELMKAHMIDFRSVLEDKNALISFQQIIRELESTQDAFSSPMVLNGSGLGWQANYSLYIGKHIAVANAAIIDLRDLLKRG